MTAIALADNPRRVIIAMDGSNHSEYAFNWYLENVHRAGNRVIVVFCPEFKGLIHSTIMTNDKELVNRMVTEEEKNAKLYLAKMQEMVKRSEVDGKVLRLFGEPGPAIIKAGKDQDADYIISGSRGLGKIRRTFLGSVSDYIMSHSPVPVDGKLVQLSGEPGEAIVKAAVDNDADFIVTGSRGLGKLKRALLGSVSMFIRKNSHIPVIVCRETDFIRKKKFTDREESDIDDVGIEQKDKKMAKSSSSLF
ncbi:hypothetical protein ScPMuIL_008626 [Solemya velum]